MDIKKLLFTLGILIVSNHLCAQSKIQEKTALTIGETIRFHSEILQEDRQLHIYIPNGYAKDSLQTYPVIYVLDGSMDEDFIHIAGLVQFGSFSWIRKRDFTFPTTNKKDKKEYPTTGASATFINFIEKEVQPLINNNYKTAGSTTLIGQSLGGLLATEILFKNPNLFDNYIITSPSLWWDDASLLAYKPTLYTSKKSIYIAVGKEGEIMERTAKALYDKLNLQKKTNTSLYFQFFEKQNHGDALHLAVYDAFEKIFKKQKQ